MNEKVLLDWIMLKQNGRLEVKWIRKQDVIFSFY
jgi:hypothetical protein